MKGVDETSLKILQDELLNVKQRYGKDATLRKTQPGAPFPILLKTRVDPPPSVSARYDVSTVEVSLTLSPAILLAPPLSKLAAAGPPGPLESAVTASMTSYTAASCTSSASESGTGSCDNKSACDITHTRSSKDEGSSWRQGVSVEISCVELPRELHTRIAAELHTCWVAYVQTTNTPSLGLATPAEFMRSQFLSLITAMPELLEGYETVDCSGATVRRHLIVGQQEQEGCGTDSATTAEGAQPVTAPGSTVSHTTPGTSIITHAASSSGAKAAAPASSSVTEVTSSVGPASNFKLSAGHKRADRLEHQQGGQHSNRRAIRDLDGVGQQQECRVAREGAGTQESMHSQQGPGQRVEHVGFAVAIAADTLYSELLFLQRRFGSGFRLKGPHAKLERSTAAVLSTLKSYTGFKLEMQPTDPSWESGPLHLEASLAPASSNTASTAQAEAVEVGVIPAPDAPSAAGGHVTASCKVPAAARPAAFAASTVPALDQGRGAAPSQSRGPAYSQGSEAGKVSTPLGDPKAARSATSVVNSALAPSGGGTASSTAGVGAEEQYVLTLHVSSTTHMPNWMCSHFNRALAKQMSSPAVAQTRGLRSIVRQLENYGGQLAAQAEQAARAAGHRTNLGQGVSACSQSTSTSNGSCSKNDGIGDGEGAGDRSSSASDTDSEESWYGDMGGIQRDDNNRNGGGGSLGQEVRQGGSDLERVGEREAADLGLEGYSDLWKGAREGKEKGNKEQQVVEDDDGAEEPRDEVAFHGGGDGETKEGGRAGTSAYHLVLEALQLDLISAVEALKAVIQVCCGRCSMPSVLSLSSDAVASGGPSTSKHDTPFQASGVCRNCHTTFEASMRTKFVHDTNNVLLLVKPTDCFPLDFLPSLLAAQCSSCSAVMSLRNVQVGVLYERSCSSCHQRLSLHIPAVSFVPVAQDPRPSKAEAAAKNRSAMMAARKGGLQGALAVFNGVLQLGQPLPGLGTCKHYHHSHRWLRFPCCGMRFPCDLCHEELSADGHGARWAQRMVCGFCSFEQVLGSQCKGCGKKLASNASNPLGRNTRFWEGGEGCRDKTRMTRRDPHKYRDSKAKTKSKKQSRVGEKPWSKMKKNEEKTQHQRSK